MNNPLGVSPSKGKQGTTPGKEKVFDLGGNRTHDLPSLCQLSYKVAQRKSGTILDGESRRRGSNLHFRVNSLFHYLCSECCAAQHSYVPLLSLRRDSQSKIVPDFLWAITNSLLVAQPIRTQH